ncbi:MAG: UDP-N-acetylmuramate dehydrogenase [Candidatus Scalindua rubra]|uniref:UDP-N-acetylenolpyruvoylglucosamine reductase n=1 Tax=Candidatus Scalindua brodae TaxID=237368 RepID=A0A0B0ENW2_9BACT|nr:MAG: UDP-N-acetylenolpyruvoylglucosamine reductase [Candidatus Scalindua brodae]MBZ0109718.1 UDP-N-acetylmuramate dehydrogenase [Candidatus Scalindua rubra]TWU32409.1 UDP-N-acetylenolpyruvoylglucosamine reductase [Candidatus Brocadiaceae bacterium S225]
MINSPEVISEIFRYNVPLKKYTSFRTGGAAEIFVEPLGVLELKRVLQFCKDEQKKIFIFGKGTNLLVGDNGVKGVVIHLGGINFKNVERDGRYVLAGAGVNLPKLIRTVALSGFGGLEALAGIPGTVGGAVMMNAGGKYGDISDSISSLTTMTFDGTIIRYMREDVEFEYRDCNLSEQIVIEVEFRLNESKIEVVLEKMDEIYNEKQENQPLGTFNAGSIFKNTSQYKAAELIDRAKLKGLKVGGAVISEKHANFIVNTGNATSSDILELMRIIKETIKKEYNVFLEEEIHIW